MSTCNPGSITSDDKHLRWAALETAGVFAETRGIRDETLATILTQIASCDYQYRLRPVAAKVVRAIAQTSPELLKNAVPLITHALFTGDAWMMDSNAFIEGVPGTSVTRIDVTDREAAGLLPALADIAEQESETLKENVSLDPLLNRDIPVRTELALIDLYTKIPQHTLA